MTGELQWYAVQGVVPQHGGRPAWTGWTCNSDGQTPWEAVQVAAHAMLLNICQRFGDELQEDQRPPFPALTQQWRSGSRLMVVRWSEVEESELRVPDQL